MLILFASFALMPFAHVSPQEPGDYEGRLRSSGFSMERNIVADLPASDKASPAVVQAEPSVQARRVRGQPRISNTRCALELCTTPCEVKRSKKDQEGLVCRMPDEPIYELMHGKVIFGDQAEVKAAGYREPKQK